MYSVCAVNDPFGDVATPIFNGLERGDKMKKRIIWSSDFDVDDYAEYLRESENCAEEDIPYAAEKAHDEELYDEQCNLNVNIDTNIIAIHTDHLWNGTQFGVSDTKSRNLSTVVIPPYNGDYCFTFEDDGKDMVCLAASSDVTNRVVFRAMRKRCNVDAMIDKLWDAKDAKERDAILKNYTRSLRPDVKAVYGW